MFLSKNKKIFLKSALTICVLFILSLFGIARSLPEKITVFQEKEEEFSFDIPISAEFSADSIGVLEINNQPVEGNINISLSEPFSVVSKDTGNTDITLSLFGLLPIKTVSVDVIPYTELVPCGKAVGVTIDTEGIMVLGTGSVNTKEGDKKEPSEGLLKSGDIIIKAGSIETDKKEDLIYAVESSNGQAVKLTILRGKEEKTVEISPAVAKEDGNYKIGVWVRDSTQGIGTLTYYNPSNGNFGALGHGVYDVDTKELMSVEYGEITASEITSIKKGEKGVPGEIVGNLDKNSVLGIVEENTLNGIYGKINENGKSMISSSAVPVALKHEVTEGEAYIITDIVDGELKNYSINIENINRYSQSADKGMVIRITDERLLNVTNGIIQGMSGSPIIQNGKIIGAVTHVFVQDPTKGYGIFIENMLSH
ncbi:MAG: SpoIVB peptidase [Lachnospiraceae bacterium]|nr:SpoIVB peptidase [Lachnospiraceae bacterium]